MALNDCIDYAMKNQTKLKSARYDEEIQIQKNNEIIGIARPQITANGQFQYLFIFTIDRIDRVWEILDWFRCRRYQRII